MIFPQIVVFSCYFLGNLLDVHVIYENMLFINTGIGYRILRVVNSPEMFGNINNRNGTFLCLVLCLDSKRIYESVVYMYVCVLRSV